MFNASVTTIVIFGIPECLLLILAIYTFGRKEVNKKDYILSSLFYLLIIIFTRSMPVLFGAHIIINIAFLILISVKLIKLPVNKAISCGLIIFALRAFTELINILMLIKIFNVDMEKTFNNEIIKNLYGLPSLLMYGCIILLANRIIKRQKY